MKDVGCLKDVLSKVDGPLEVFHNHCTRVQAVVGACVSWEYEADDGMSGYFRFHLGRCSNDRARALCELHIVCCM